MSARGISRRKFLRRVVCGGGCSMIGWMTGWMTGCTKRCVKGCGMAGLALLLGAALWRPAFAADVGRLNSLINTLASDPNNGGVKNQIENICLEAGRPGAEAERAAACMAILAKLGHQTPTDARTWLLRQLERIGGAEVVGGLAQLLRDQDARVRECARRALETNPSPQAGKALRKALDRTKNVEWRVALINALGGRRDEASAGDLVKVLKDRKKGRDDKQGESAAIAAAVALGKIGGSEAAKALSSARSKGSLAFRLAATDAYLSCADRFLAEGYFTEAAAIYKKLYSPKGSNLVRIAAMQGLAAVQTARASGKRARRLKRKSSSLSSSGRRTASVAARKPTVDAEVVKAWDAKLEASIQKSLRAGGKPSFYLESMRTRVKVVGVEDDGTLKISSRGMELGFTMSRLKMSDKKNLAAAVAGGDPEGNAVAAFYCLAVGKTAEAGPHLRRAGDLGQEVRDAIE